MCSFLLLVFCLPKGFAYISGRQTQSFDAGWKFFLGEHPGYNQTNPSCSDATFPLDLTGIRCDGMRTGHGTMHSAAECEQQCCTNSWCEVWQWCDAPGATPGCDIGGARCWMGTLDACEHSNVTANGWTSRGRRPSGPPHGYIPPVPPPQPCPSSPTCVAFDDSPWRKLSVPHDFIVEGTFSPDADRNHGYLPYNLSYYRKTFEIDPEWKGWGIGLDVLVCAQYFVRIQVRELCYLCTRIENLYCSQHIYC